MAGSRRHLVTLQTRSDALDAYGQESRSYTVLAEVWAEIRMVSGAERQEGQRIEAEVSHRIRFRYAPEFDAVSPNDRIVYGQRTFDILSIDDPDGRRRELVAATLEQA